MTRRATTGRSSRSGPATPTTAPAPDAITDPATGVVAAHLRDAVLAVPGVTGLAPGNGVEVATHFPGGKIIGIRLGDPVEIHVGIGPVPIAPVAAELRTAVRGVLRRFGRESPVEVVVEDVDLPAPVTMAGS